MDKTLFTSYLVQYKFSLISPINLLLSVGTVHKLLRTNPNIIYILFVIVGK